MKIRQQPVNHSKLVARRNKDFRFRPTRHQEIARAAFPGRERVTAIATIEGVLPDSEERRNLTQKGYVAH